MTVCFSFVNAEALVWSTYWGGSRFWDEAGESGMAIAADPDGNSVVGGWTSASDFPVTEGAFQPAWGGNLDCFVMKFDAVGQNLIFCTFIGGEDREQVASLVLTSDLQPVVVGTTRSDNFPTTDGAFQEALSGGSDAFVAKLNSDGDSLLFGTYLGGSSSETGMSVVRTDENKFVVGGETTSQNFPTTDNPFQEALRGGEDGFITCLDTDGDGLVFSTLIGGDSYENVTCVDLDVNGDIYLTGNTGSENFPVTENAVQNELAGGTDGFVARLDGEGTRMLYGTFLGGSENETLDKIVADVKGGYYLTGFTYSQDYPLSPNPFQGQFGGGDMSAFLTHIGAAGDEFVFSTFFSRLCFIKSLVAVPDGGVLFGGMTSDAMLQTTEDAYQRALNRLGDCFVARFDSLGLNLRYATYFGGRMDEMLNALTVHKPDGVIFTGFTESRDFPVTEGAYQSQPHYGFTSRIEVQLPCLCWVQVPDTIEVDESALVTFSVVGRSISLYDELTITCESEDLPDDISFIDNGDGTGEFSWQTSFSDAGEYLATFTLSDGENEIRANVTIIINDAEGVSDIIPHPSSFILSVPFPNPFNSSTTIRFGLPVAGEASLRVTDTNGRLMAILVEGRFEAGYHEVVWEASDFPVGVYLVELTTISAKIVRTAAIIK